MVTTNAQRNADFLILRRPRRGRLEGRGNPRRDAAPLSFETPAAQAPQDEGVLYAARGEGG
jgi:hypothetical protein